jgi:Secretion system C-terminal sorting domain/Cleaved Adhesin Domain
MAKAILTISFFISVISFGQSILLNETFSAGIPATWAIVDEDGQTPNAAVSQFTDGFIWYQTSEDSSAASSSYFDTSTSAANDYLILPKLSLLTVSKLSWEARSVDASYPESYHVLLSTTDSLTSSFTDTLLTVDGENYLWNRKSILLDTMGFANQDVYIAFNNYTTEGFILEIDDVLVEASDNVGIEEAVELFKFYPNPASDFLSLEISEPFDGQIIDLNGKVILNFNSTKVDVSNISSGNYILSVSTQSNIQRSSLIIY